MTLSTIRPVCHRTLVIGARPLQVCEEITKIQKINLLLKIIRHNAS